MSENAKRSSRNAGPLLELCDGHHWRQQCTICTTWLTLRAPVYELLTDVEQAMLRRLSVFAGGSTLSAKEHVCSEYGIDICQIFVRNGTASPRAAVVRQVVSHCRAHRAFAGCCVPQRKASGSAADRAIGRLQPSPV